MNKNIWLIGSGGMAVDYVRVLQALELEFSIIGRGEKSAKACLDATGCEVVSGGLVGYLATKPPVPTHAIVAVGVEKLHETTLQLLDYGVQNILVEKPAGLNEREIEAVSIKAKEKNARVCVAYNRRFYASVLKAQEIIAEDGGITSFNFEFTEWAHEIEKLSKGEGVKEHWFLGNSTHVVDLALYLGGKPKEICTFTSGSLDWHPAASIFAGAGVSENGALFSYQANWESAGRWSVEMLTKKHRLILRPMEKLQIQKRGSVAIEFVECDYKLDEAFKPGLFLQTKKFISNDFQGMCSISDQFAIMDKYNSIAGYKL
ncbi:MAG: Gfo/Idh/MocA family oxidoreductase [Sideroxyarcus sp.]|nr:Gfo/Idh/MocA family oxidoreductase [Sideroxyarcus sp.]